MDRGCVCRLFICDKDVKLCLGLIQECWAAQSFLLPFSDLMIDDLAYV